MIKKRTWLGNALTVVDHVMYHVLEKVGVPQEITSLAVLQVVLTHVRICVQIPVILHVLADVIEHAQTDV